MPDTKATNDEVLTIYMLVKTTPEFLAMSVRDRLEFGRRELQPILDEFRDRIRLRWFDTEFYNARITDVVVFEAKDHRSYELVCEKLRETPFWDRYFQIEDILPGKENAWARNYNVDPLRS